MAEENEAMYNRSLKYVKQSLGTRKLSLQSGKKIDSSTWCYES